MDRPSQRSSTLRLHDLLLTLAGRLDDSALSHARRLAALARLDDAVELVTGALVAGGIALRAAEQRELGALLASCGSEPALAERVVTDDGAVDGAEPHRFSAADDPDTGVADAVDPVVAMLPDVRTVHAVWRNTVAGSVPGPMPQRVVLIGVGPDGAPAATAHRAESALRAAGISATVEVTTPDTPPSQYHRAALAAAVPAISHASPPRPSGQPHDDRQLTPTQYPDVADSADGAVPSAGADSAATPPAAGPIDDTPTATADRSGAEEPPTAAGSDTGDPAAADASPRTEAEPAWRIVPMAPEPATDQATDPPSTTSAASPATDETPQTAAPTTTDYPWWTSDSSTDDAEQGPDEVRQPMPPVDADTSGDASGDASGRAAVDVDPPPAATEPPAGIEPLPTPDPPADIEPSATVDPPPAATEPPAGIEPLPTPDTAAEPTTGTAASGSVADGAGPPWTPVTSGPGTSHSWTVEEPATPNPEPADDRHDWPAASGPDTVTATGSGPDDARNGTGSPGATVFAFDAADAIRSRRFNVPPDSDPANSTDLAPGELFRAADSGAIHKPSASDNPYSVTDFDVPPHADDSVPPTADPESGETPEESTDQLSPEDVERLRSAIEQPEEPTTVQRTAVAFPSEGLDNPRLSDRDRELLRELHAELAKREREQATQVRLNGKEKPGG